MAMTVMHNAGAQLSLGELNKNINKAGKALARVSTGERLVSAGDGDSSSYAISERMRERIRSLLQDNQNVQNGSSMLRVAERGVDQIIEELRTLKELAIDSANDSNTDEDRRTIQKEFDSRRDTIDDIALGTKYNGKGLIGGEYKKILATTPYEDPPGSGKMDDRTKVDIVFVVDTTGSMGSYIKKVASNLKIFSDSLTAKGLNWQFGLVRYDDITSTSPKDIGVSKISFSSGDFTKDADEFTAALTELDKTLGYGGDYPESGYEGVMEATKASFRDESLRRIIVLSDATVKKKERGNGDLSTDDVLNALKDSGTTLTAITSTGSGIYDDWGVLADATKGKLYSIAGDYGSQLREEATNLKWEADGPASEYLHKTLVGNPLWIQHGTQAGQHVNVYIEDMGSKALGIDAAEVNTREKAISAISIVESALEMALDEATNLGSWLNRLEYTDSNITTMGENVQNAESTIRDADMAKQMTDYLKYNILSQSSQAMLAQANQSSSAILGLLQ